MQPETDIFALLKRRANLPTLVNFADGAIYELANLKLWCYAPSGDEEIHTCFRSRKEPPFGYLSEDDGYDGAIYSSADVVKVTDLIDELVVFERQSASRA